MADRCRSLTVRPRRSVLKRARNGAAAAGVTTRCGASSIATCTPTCRRRSRRRQRTASTVALSNPCIELWFILHFGDQTAHLEHDEAQSRSKKLLGCEKTLTPKALVELEGRYEDAGTRARNLDDKHLGDGSPRYSNPSSNLWELIDRIPRPCVPVTSQIAAGRRRGASCDRRVRVTVLSRRRGPTGAYGSRQTTEAASWKCPLTCGSLSSGPQAQTAADGDRDAHNPKVAGVNGHQVRGPSGRRRRVPGRPHSESIGQLARTGSMSTTASALAAPAYRHEGTNDHSEEEGNRPRVGSSTQRCQSRTGARSPGTGTASTNWQTRTGPMVSTMNGRRIR